MSETHAPPTAEPPAQGAPFRSSEFKIIYADTFSIRATPIDMQVTFSVQTLLPQLQNVPGSSQVMGVQIAAVMEQVTIAMPLPTLKGLYLHLKALIELAESEIGPIRVPVSMRTTEQQLEAVRQNFRNNQLVDAPT
jgi:hypothetical protein